MIHQCDFTLGLDMGSSCGLIECMREERRREGERQLDGDREWKSGYNESGEVS